MPRIKHKIQDLIDNDVIEFEDPNDSPKQKEGIISKHDQNYEPVSSNGLHVASISSMMPPSFKASQQQSISYPSNNEPNDETFHVGPQGLSQGPSHPMVEKNLTSLESHEDPIIPFYFFQDDPLPSQEKSMLPKKDHDASSTFSNDPIQNEESNTLSNGPLPCQDQSIPSSPFHNAPHSSQRSIMSTKPPHDPTS